MKKSTIVTFPGKTGNKKEDKKRKKVLKELADESHIIKKTLKGMNKKHVEMMQRIYKPEDCIEYTSIEQQVDFIKNTFINKKTQVIEDDKIKMIVFGRTDVEANYENVLKAMHGKKCKNLTTYATIFTLLTLLETAQYEHASWVLEEFFKRSSYMDHYKLILMDDGMLITSTFDEIIKLSKKTEINHNTLSFRLESQSGGMHLTLSIQDDQIMILACNNVKGCHKMNKEFLVLLNKIKKDLSHVYYKSFITKDHIATTDKDNKVKFIYKYSDLSDTITINFPKNQAVREDALYEQYYIATCGGDN